MPEHMSQLEKQSIKTIDLVVVNLYPFVQTIAKQGVTWEEALENIDIGGPTLLRAAAKNFPDVIVVVDPEDYPRILEQLRQGEISWQERKRLAYKAFQHVALYDTAIAQYLRQGEAGFPEELTVALRKCLDLRYGENPHQRAVFYEEVGRSPGWSLVSAVQLGGRELSFNNILDLDAALKVVREFSEPAVAIIKHNNPCGLATHPDLTEAYRRALSGDPVAAFGGVVALNKTVDLGTAAEIDKTHYDAIIAPQYEEKALELLRRKRELRLLAIGAESVSPPSARPSSLDFRRVEGGFLVQEQDFFGEEELSFRTVSQRAPEAEERRDLVFALRAVKHVKSNAIVLAKEETLVGMGAGQPSRVASVEIALKKAGERAKGSVLASDAFFPFSDGVELAAKSGVTAIVQPGGSVRDNEIIGIADQYGIAMVFTGVRHFKH
jgi:phosphoribosylaminoimidazolecarboxamide formyltransferase/IMP cyclohydrolase